MKEIFRTYQSKNGYEVTIIKFTEGDKIFYQVKHSNPYLSTGDFYDNRRDAIIQAQFLSGNY